MISLYGALARQFEKKYQTSAKNINIRVKSATEMLKAMEANFSGFRGMLKQKVQYRISRGGTFKIEDDLNPAEMKMNFGTRDWHIMPVAAGCKKSGLMSTILGAVMIVAGAVVSYFGAPAIGGPMMKMGFAMALGGAAQMLASNPNAGDYAVRENPESRPSYLSGSPVNAVEPGLTMPVGYGDFWAGTISVSAGMKVEDI